MGGDGHSQSVSPVIGQVLNVSLTCPSPPPPPVVGITCPPHRGGAFRCKITAVQPVVQWTAVVIESGQMTVVMVALSVSVSRFFCESESFKMDLILDVNTQIYPVQHGACFFAYGLSTYSIICVAFVIRSTV